MTTDRQAGGKADRPRPPRLGDVIDRMLDKGVDIRSHHLVSMLDIGLLGVSSQVSVMTIDRWDLLEDILSVERPRRRSKSPARVRAYERGPDGLRHQGDVRQQQHGLQQEAADRRETSRRFAAR